MGWDLGTVLLHPFISGFLMGCSQGVHWAVAQMEKKSASKLMWWLPGFGSPKLVELRIPFLTATGHRPPWVPCYIGLSITAACFINVFKPRRQRRQPTSNMEVKILCNLFLEEVSPGLCQSLLVGGKSPGLAKPQGVRVTQGHGIRKWWSLWALWEASGPQVPLRGAQSRLDSNKAEWHK